LSEAIALETIEAEAFESCSSLEKLSVPANVTVVEKGVLEGCNALKYLHIASPNPAIHIRLYTEPGEDKKLFD